MKKKHQDNPTVTETCDILPKIGSTKQVLALDLVKALNPFQGAKESLLKREDGNLKSRQVMELRPVESSV